MVNCIIMLVYTTRLGHSSHLSPGPLIMDLLHKTPSIRVYCMLSASKEYVMTRGE